MLNQTATYAVRAMAYLAHEGTERSVLAREIAEAMEIPRNFLSKIMNRLVREGLVNSVRGTGGGFRIARDPKTVTLRDVIDPFMDLASYRTCFLGRAECDGSCGVHDRWVGIAEQFEKLIDEVSIDKVRGTFFWDQ